MRRALPWFLLLAAALGAAAWWSGLPGSRPDARVASGDGTPAHEHGHWQCAMHPQVVSDRPGNCPICGMTLVFVADEPETGGRGLSASEKPAVGGDVPPASEGGIAGRVGVTIEPDRQQLIGVRTGEVAVRRLEREIRAAGRVAYDPKAFQALSEYREALRAQRELAGSSSPEARAGAEGLARAARLRLRQQGVSDEQAREVLRGGEGAESLLLPGRSVWIYAQVHDRDAPLVRPGQRMAVSTQALPGRVFETRVASIDPILDRDTRTVRVRARVETPGAELRPESLVEARIFVSSTDVLAVPREAVVDTGLRQLVFVVRDGHRFEPRPVTLGREGGDFLEVLSGLRSGERVVVSANFLVDSESRFRAAAAGFGGAGAAAPAPSHAGHGGGAAP